MNEFKTDGKTPFGKWVSQHCNRHKITPRDLYDHTGIKARTMQRILTGQTVLSDINMMWIIESIADLTNDDPVELGCQVIRVYLPTTVQKSGSK